VLVPFCNLPAYEASQRIAARHSGTKPVSVFNILDEFPNPTNAAYMETNIKTFY
jgi:hypothetical protein